MFSKRLILPVLLLLTIAACGPAPAPGGDIAGPDPATTAGGEENAGAQAAAGGEGAAAPEPPARAMPLRVVAVETFLADIVRNVAGERADVTALLPIGVDPHAFEPTPADLRRVADADLVVVNGAGLEAGFLAQLTQGAGGGRPVMEASRGLTFRVPGPDEVEVGHEAADAAGTEAGAVGDESGDPHFWLDPVLAMTYVDNIRAGLTAADPAGAAAYAANAEAYQQRLADLDGEIRLLVGTIPADRRLLVTDHDNLGYFADRYGFRVVGTVIPGFSTGASPSARQLAALVDQIRATGAPAIFLATGANPRLAEQVAGETGAQVVMDLHTHSVTTPDGPAPTYLDMIRANARAIVAALGAAD